MEFHEYAGIFPLMQGREFDELCADIKANGLRCPIVLHTDGSILDGRNRYRACLSVGVTPVYESWNGEGLASDFVWSLNGPRRHLDGGALAMASGRYAIAREDEARGRQGARTDLTSVSIDTEVGFGRSREQAAAKFGVSEPTVARAMKVAKDGTDELIQAVESGKVSVSAAADVATLPKEEQTVIVARGEKEILEAAKSIRTEKAVAKRVENEKLKAETRAIELPAGKYRTIVIDPPWDMKKIPRTVDTLHHEELDYPTMTLEEIAAFPVADMAHDEAIIYCWTTQKYLPNTFDILAAWGFRYLVTMVWHKPGGFQPFGLPQYNCEFVLIGRKDGCAFDDTKAFMLCNQWPRREHSRKPDEFYDLVRRVSPGPRIDVFSREERDGFDQFGNQTEKFGGAA